MEEVRTERQVWVVVGKEKRSKKTEQEIKMEE